MRLEEILAEGADENQYFEVQVDTPVYIRQGTKPTGHYYGSSQYHTPTYREHWAEPGDQLHFLVGGLFLVQKVTGKAFGARLVQPGDFSPFEKNYSGSYVDSNVAALKELVANGEVMQINPSYAIKARYNS